MSIRRMLRIAFRYDQRIAKKHLLVDGWLGEDFDNSMYIKRISRRAK